MHALRAHVRRHVLRDAKAQYAGSAPALKGARAEACALLSSEAVRGTAQGHSRPHAEASGGPRQG
eukprot:11110979-Alexandrium_andersonii.AAC.1